MLVAGVVLRDWPNPSDARSKRLREAGSSTIPNALFDAAIKGYKKQSAAQASEIEREKDKIIEDYAKSKVYKPQFLEKMRHDVQRGLAFFHDYKQINTQIIQNINVLIESRYQGATFEEKLGKSQHSEKAIYEAAKFLEEKLNVAKFLLNPDWLYIRDECVRFRVHGLVVKYVRIYQRQFDSRGIKVHVAGESHNEIVANPQACGVIPHTLLDNALKYSTRGGRVEIDIQDEGPGVYFAVGSYGPCIRPEEASKIFLPFFRGQHAIERSEEGAGYGLYITQFIAKEHLGTTVAFEQAPNEEKGLGFWTSFEVTFPEKARILE